MPPKTKSVLGKETTRSQDKEGSPIIEALNVKVPLMIKRLERRSGPQEEEIQNPIIAKTVSTLSTDPIQG